MLPKKPSVSLLALSSCHPKKIISLTAPDWQFAYSGRRVDCYMKIHIIIEYIIVRFTVFIFKLKALNRKISLWNTELVMLNKF